MMQAQSQRVAHRTAVVADIHGNSPALEAVARGIHAAGCTETYVLGDIINGVDPVGALSLVRGLPNPQCVKGTAEFYLVTPDLKRMESLYGDPLITGTVPNLLWWRARMSSADLAEIEAMPDIILVGGRCYIHDTLQDRFRLGQWEVPGVPAAHQEIHHHSRGLHRDDADDVFDEVSRLMQERSIDELYVGHTHEPFVRAVGHGLICNPGSVGMPLDGDWRASWMLVERPADAAASSNALESARPTVRRVEYDIDRTFHLLERAAGSWPTVDTLEKLRRYKRRLEIGLFL